MPTLKKNRLYLPGGNDREKVNNELEGMQTEKYIVQLFLFIYENKPFAVLRSNHVSLKRGRRAKNKMKHMQTHSTAKVSQQNTDKFILIACN